MSESVLGDGKEKKQFLKRNEFVEMFKRVVAAMNANRNVVYLAIALVFALILGVVGLRLYRMQTVKAFSSAWDQAASSSESEKAYMAILSKYGSLPASDLARLKVLEGKDVAAATALLRDGLKDADTSIVSTVLVFKGADLLKADGQFDQSASWLGQYKAKVLNPLQGRLLLTQGDLFLLAGSKDKAKSVYQDLANRSVVTAEGEKPFDPQVIDEAKDKILMMELGAL